MSVNHSQVAHLPDREAARDALVRAWTDECVVPPFYNLPPRPAGIVGREEDLGRVRQFLKEHRLVTLVGPGGVGKSCLALQVAWESLPDFCHGVRLINLEALNDPDLLVSAVAGGVGFSFYTPIDPGGQLLDYLRAKEILLVLDNFEHLLPATDLVSAILPQAPGVKILVTSRERLCLREEWVFEVKGLRFPPDETEANAHTYSAVQVFLQSARRAQAEFSPTDQDMLHVAHICRLVSGLPLALDLAGAWVRVLSCQEIAQEIEHSLDFLTTTWRDLPERHHSLRAVCDHSWSLLAEQDRRILCALSVFRGGITPSATGQVAGASLTDLARLIDRSFLRWNAGSERYEMHAFLRQYAEEKLDADPAEAERVRERHCACFAAFLHGREQALKGHGQQQALKEIEAEIDNVRQAWDWAVAQVNIAQVEQSLESLHWFYLIRSHSQEGWTVFAQADARLSETGQHASQARRLAWKLRARQCMLDYSLSRTREACTRIQDCLDAFTVLDDTAEIALCLSILGITLYTQGKWDLARERLEQAISVARSASVPDVEGGSLSHLGLLCLHTGELAAAKRYHEQALHVHRRTGNPLGESIALNCLGATWIKCGDYGQAKAYCEQALWIIRGLGDRWGEIQVLDNLGTISVQRGDYDEATRCYERILRISREIGRWQNEGMTLASLGLVHARQGDHAAARDYYERASCILEKIDYRLGVCQVLAGQAELCHTLGDETTSLAYSQRLEDVARDDGYALEQGAAWTNRGLALAGLGRLEEAIDALQGATELYRAHGHSDGLLQSLAGLVHVHLAQDLDEALRHTEEILQHLGQRSPGDIAEPFGPFGACCRALRAGRDPRAQAILKTAHDLLQERAARIGDEEMRRSYMENVPAHREILAAFQSQVLGGGASGEALPEPLTGREMDVLRLIAAGLTNQEIAEALVVEVGTVKSHAHNFYAKLNVRNRTQALARARELGLLSDLA